MGSRLRFVSTMVATMILATASVAAAHFVYEQGRVWASQDGKCLGARSEVSDGNVDQWGQHGYTKVDAEVDKRFQTPPGIGIDCVDGWDQAAGHLRVRTVWKVCNDNFATEATCTFDSSWVLCATLPYKHNNNTTDKLTQEKFWNLDCGTGIYANFGSAHLSFGEGWKGGTMYSGPHHLQNACDVLDCNLD